MKTAVIMTNKDLATMNSKYIPYCEPIGEMAAEAGGVKRASSR